MFTLDRDKYFAIVEAEGLPAAITALHNDMRDWEYETFEGQAGFTGDSWAELEQARAFSRELWDIGLKSDQTG